MNTALELFQKTPREHNCAQAVAAGCGHPELAGELASCGGGRAPEGRCGALHAALLMLPPERREAARQAFIQANGSEFCKELKSVHRVPCTQCVAVAAGLAE
jgi:hypothetical protein